MSEFMIVAAVAACLVILMLMDTKRKPKMQLTDETNALLAHAFALKAEAVNQDADVEEAGINLVLAEKALVEAQQVVTDETAEAVSAHRDASEASMTALKAVAAELGIVLPEQSKHDCGRRLS